MPPKAAKYHPKPPDVAKGRQMPQTVKTRYGMRRNIQLTHPKGVDAATCRQKTPNLKFNISSSMKDQPKRHLFQPFLGAK
jgi:hypothetical protein